MQIEAHAADPSGTSSNMPIGRRRGADNAVRLSRSSARRWNNATALFASRRLAGGLSASAAKAASRSSGADKVFQPGRIGAKPNRSAVRGMCTPQTSSARNRSQRCSSAASRSARSTLRPGEFGCHAIHDRGREFLRLRPAPWHPGCEQALPQSFGRDGPIRSRHAQPAFRLSKLCRRS